MKTIKTYEQAKEYLGGKRERPYANNTRIEMDTLDLGHEVITIKYHGNPVVNMFPDGTNTYSSCGWKTLTTKERINWFLPDGFSLYQEKSVWYIVKHGTSYRYGFMDGIAIKNGDVYNDAPTDESKKVKQSIKVIKQYVEGYIKALFAGDVPEPSGGDCWLCLMVTNEGKSLGDATGDNEHILSHLEESYFVPSLLVNADNFNHRLSQFAKGTVAQLWAGQSVSDWQIDITSRQVKACLTGFLKHELGIAQ